MKSRWNLMKGPQAGQWRFASDVDGGGGGLDISAAVSNGEYYYSGDINNFTFESFSGARWDVSLGITEGIDFSGTFVTSIHPDKYGGYIMGWELAIGAGKSLSLVSFSSTIGATKFGN